LGLNAKVDYNFLEMKTGITNEKDLKSSIIAHCQSIDMEQMAADVQPFLFNSTDTKKILFFEQFLSQYQL
jgi:hypothetical protein